MILSYNSERKILIYHNLEMLQNSSLSCDNLLVALISELSKLAFTCFLVQNYIYAKQVNILFFNYLDSIGVTEYGREQHPNAYK